MSEQMRLRAAIHNNSKSVYAQNEETGEIREFRKTKGGELIDMETLKKAGGKWIEQSVFTRMQLMRLLCLVGIGWLIMMALWDWISNLVNKWF